MTRVILALSIAAAAMIAACHEPLPPADGQKMGSADAKKGSDAKPGTCSNTSAYLQSCVDPSTCMGCNCAYFGHQSYCSQTCMTVADCPAPATACAQPTGSTVGYCMK